MEQRKRTQLPLTSQIFYILLVLAEKERHGYDIMKQVNEESKGKIKLGPGTLYTALKRMLLADIVEEVTAHVDPLMDNQRRKYYQLTQIGRNMLDGELQRYSDALSLAKKYHLLEIACS